MKKFDWPIWVLVLSFAVTVTTYCQTSGSASQTVTFGVIRSTYLLTSKLTATNNESSPVRRVQSAQAPWSALQAKITISSVHDQMRDQRYSDQPAKKPLRTAVDTPHGAKWDNGIEETDVRSLEGSRGSVLSSTEPLTITITE